jgi:transcriptional regulator with XRE-family HTH domain
MASVKLRQDSVDKVRDRLRVKFYSQKDLADELGIAQSTVSNFLNCISVYRQIFQDICEKLGFDDWRSLAEPPNTSTSYVEPPNNPQNDLEIEEIETFEFPEGEVPLGSPFYVERHDREEFCYGEIAKPHALIRIKAPRQFGKSSLLTRILERSETQGNVPVYLSLQQATQQQFENIDRLLQWLCICVASEASHTFKEDDYQQRVRRLGSKLGTQEYFKYCLLPEIDRPLTIGLDEVDRVFEYANIYNEFFSFLRSLHEAGKRKSILNRLRLVITYSTEVYVPIDLNQSPFNVGITVELPEFSQEQVQDLAHRHQLNWTFTEVDRLMAMVGGHPFLIRHAIYHIACQNITLNDFSQTALTSIYQSYLDRLKSILEARDLAVAMKQVVFQDKPVSFPTAIAYKLEGMGLVKLHSDGITPRCELYRQYFREAL